MHLYVLTNIITFILSVLIVVFRIVKNVHHLEQLVNKQNVLQIINMSMVFVVKTLLVIVMLCLKVLNAIVDIIFLIKPVYNVNPDVNLVWMEYHALLVKMFSQQ